MAWALNLHEIREFGGNNKNPQKNKPKTNKRHNAHTHTHIHIKHIYEDKMLAIK